MSSQVVLVATLVAIAVAFWWEWKLAQRRAEHWQDEHHNHLEQQNLALHHRVKELERTQDELTSMALQTTHPALREAQTRVNDGLRRRMGFAAAIEKQLAAIEDDEYREELTAEIADAYNKNPGLDPDDIIQRYFSEAR